MDIRTKYHKNAAGAGRITATGTIEGKRRQKTVPYDHSISRNRNHGRAAAALGNLASMSEQRRLQRSVTTVQATWTDHGNEGFTFTFPDN